MAKKNNINNNNLASKSKKRLKMMMILSIPFAIIFKMSFMFFIIGMLPAIISYLVDNDKNKYSSSTIFALNFAGVFPYMMDIFMRGGDYRAVEAKLSDISVWFVMYGSAALGLVFVLFSPIIAAAALDGIYKGRIMHLENLQKKTIEDWGTEIKGRDNKDEDK